MATYGRVSRGSAAMAEMNVTPLIDVMLVLLIVFMMAAPLLTRSIAIELPQRDPKAKPQITAPIRIAIKANGEYFWNGAAITLAALPQVMAEAANLQPQPIVELAAEGDADYQAVASVLAGAKAAGLRQIGFRENTD